MIAIDRWDPASAWQRHHSSGSCVGADVLEMILVDPRRLEPLFGGAGLRSEGVVAAGLSLGEADVEPERESFVMPIAWNVQGTDNWTALAVDVDDRVSELPRVPAVTIGTYDGATNKRCCC